MAERNPGHAEARHRGEAEAEAAIIVFDLPESSVTPIMEQVESTYARVKSFSLPSMGEDERGRRVGGRHIELGVRGEPAEVALAIEQMKTAVVAIQDNDVAGTFEFSAAKFQIREDGTKVMETTPWILLFPAGLLSVTLYCANYIGDGMRDALDPKDR